jgi:3-deoxy-D-manno-octulosonic-acid transferase
VNPLLRLPYAGVIGLARALSIAPLPGDGKIARSLRARSDAAERLVDWGRSSRDPSRPLLWVHAPSVGEGLQARPVIERIRAQHPHVQLIYTHFSPSAERFAASVTGAGADFVGYLPFDAPSTWSRVLDAVRPSAIVFAKLDLWPLLVECAQARGVRLGLISGTLSRASARRGVLSRALSTSAFAALDAIGAISAEDAERLVDIGVRRDRVEVTGDTRFDQVLARAEAADRGGALLGPLALERPTLIAGSTWPTDEAQLLPAWTALRADVPNARLIIAPHEPTAAHLAPIRAWAAREGLSVSSFDAAGARDADVVLVDRVGVLGDLYALADVAYVGGAFHGAGLHSVVEPAAFGVPVLFGPQHGTSREASLLLAARGAAAVEDSTDLLEALRIAFTEPDARANGGRAARRVVEEGRGAADRSAALVARLLGLS